MCSKPRSKSHMTGYYRASHWLSSRISRLLLGISSLRLLQAKTAIAPLDRVKILFQTSNADFKQYAGERELGFTFLSGISVNLAKPDADQIFLVTSFCDLFYCGSSGRPTGLYHAMKAILAAQGVRGLFQGHLATLLRIFPYAGVKFMAYDKVEGVSFGYGRSGVGSVIPEFCICG